MTRLTPTDTAHAYKLSELVLYVSESVKAVSEWCRSVSIDTSVGSVECVRKCPKVMPKVSKSPSAIDTGVSVKAGFLSFMEYGGFDLRQVEY